MSRPGPCQFGSDPLPADSPWTWDEKAVALIVVVFAIGALLGKW